MGGGLLKEVMLLDESLGMCGMEFLSERRRRRKIGGDSDIT